MCMNIHRWVLDGKAEGVGWKIMRRYRDELLSYSILGQYWVPGEWKEASLHSSALPNSCSAPQGIYVFPEKPTFDGEVWNKIVFGSSLAAVLAKVEWQCLLAEGFDGDDGFSTYSKNITVLRARVVEIEEPARPTTPKREGQ